MSLATLRSDPQNACLRNVYRTGPAPGSFTGQGAIVEGGRCTIAATEVTTGVFDLKAIASNYASTDYFYPWLRQGVGWVQIPKNVPDGTIVMTGGVNGCTLVVTEFLSNYFFYNDGDSKMTAIPASAVIFDKNKNFVMIFKDKYNIETRTVEVYRQNGETAYISSGLKPGEKVVSKNQLFLYDALND